MPVDNSPLHAGTTQKREKAERPPTRKSRIITYVHPLSRAQVHRAYTRTVELPLINADGR